jgi:ribose 5-phosphate isomerase B
MKSFEMITESDARVLAPGETVMLARGGHITPLAQDTLRERRVTVVREGSTRPDDRTLVPAAAIRTVAIASDHTGVTLRRELVVWLRGRGLAVNDLGTDGTDPVDYPDVAASVADVVARGDADGGIVIDGAGIGSAIAANKVKGIRAVMAANETIARYSREHNGANVLTLGATLVSAAEARAIVTTWLTTPMREPRYIARLAKIRDLERRG